MNVRPILNLHWKHCALCAVLVGTSACGGTDGAAVGGETSTSEAGASSSSGTSTSGGAESSTSGLEGTSSSSSSSTGDSPEETDTGSSTGTGELLECFPEESTFGVGLVDGFFDWEINSSILSDTTCMPGAPELTKDADGVARTRIPLECPNPEPKGDDPTSYTFFASITGAFVALGPEPVQVSFYYYLEEDHMFGSEAEYEFTITRGGRILLFGANGVGLDGVEVITGDRLCGSPSGDCGFELGVAGLSPEGEPVRELDGKPVVLMVGAHQMLVQATGVVPQDCPDGTEPYDPNTEMSVSAVDTEFIVES